MTLDLDNLHDAAGCARAAQACQPLIVAAEAWAQHHERLRDAGADYHGTEQDLLEAVHGLRLARSVAPQPGAGPQVATMLNALPALLADHARLVAEVARLRGVIRDARKAWASTGDGDYTMCALR